MTGGKGLHPFVLVVLPAECNLTSTVFPVQALCAGAKRAGGVLPRNGRGGDGGCGAGGCSRGGGGGGGTPPPSPARLVLTLSDAARAAATRSVDLSGTPAADAVAVLFFKFFGDPTGLGALLLARHSPAVRALVNLLRPPAAEGVTDGAAAAAPPPSALHWAGGTVAVAPPTARAGRPVALPPPAGLEKGTPHCLGVAALPVGPDPLASVGGMAVICARAAAAAAATRAALARSAGGRRPGPPADQPVIASPPPTAAASASACTAAVGGTVVAFSVHTRGGG